MFSEAGIHGSIDTILYPVHHGILYFSGMEVLPPYVAWSPDRVSDAQRELYLREFSQRLQSIETTEPLLFHPLSHYGSTLLKKKWIAPFGNVEPGSSKKKYVITDLGKQMAEKELNRLGELYGLASRIIGGEPK